MEKTTLMPSRSPILHEHLLNTMHLQKKCMKNITITLTMDTIIMLTMEINMVTKGVAENNGGTNDHSAHPLTPMEDDICQLLCYRMQEPRTLFKQVPYAEEQEEEQWELLKEEALRYDNSASVTITGRQTTVLAIAQPEEGLCKSRYGEVDHQSVNSR